MSNHILALDSALDCSLGAVFGTAIGTSRKVWREILNVLLNFAFATVWFWRWIVFLALDRFFACLFLALMILWGVGAGPGGDLLSLAVDFQHVTIPNTSKLGYTLPANSHENRNPVPE